MFKQKTVNYTVLTGLTILPWQKIVTRKRTFKAIKPVIITNRRNNERLPEKKLLNNVGN